MELQRNQASLDFWEMAADFSATQEEHAEMIIPDHCPDMAKILTAEGTVFLKSSEVRDGKATLSGAIRVSVLYIPEKSTLVQSVSYTVPFQMTENCPSDCTQLQASVSSEELTARMLNPRKLRLQCRLSANICAFRYLSSNYTCGIAAEPQHSVELQTQHEKVSVLIALAEKEFSYQDTLHLPQNRGAVSQVLCSRVSSFVEDAKIIGTKAVVKGRHLAVFLLKYESGTCENSSFELPFSHIMELNAPQEAKLTARLALTDLTVESFGGEDGGSELQVTIQTRIQLSVTETRELSFITDLYSTAFSLTAEWQDLKILDAEEPQTRRQICQDTLEVGVPAERLLLLSAACGPVTTQGSSEFPELRTLLHLQALYLTEDGRVLSSERSTEVTLPYPDGTGGLRCVAGCGEEISSVMTGDGMIVRIPVDFHLMQRKLRNIRFVSAASLDEAAKTDSAQMPSLVLRKKKKEECLWDLAKRCGSTVRDILAANGCECEEDLHEEKMLLIPKRRA